MISIIIPVFNSENTIEILVNNIVQTLGEHYKFVRDYLADRGVHYKVKKS